MTYVPVDVPAFGGLDLRDPEDATGSPDLLDVRFDRQDGVLTTAPGYSAVGSQDHDIPGSLYWSSGLSRFMVGDPSSGLLVSQSSTGTSGASASVGSGAWPWSFVDAPGGSSPSLAVYCANGLDPIVRYRSGTFTTLSAGCSTKAVGESSFSAYTRTAPVATALCVQSPDKRLVAAGGFDTTGGPNALASNSSYVWFSQPGNAEKWDETDYVDLGNDGESVTAAVSWGNNVFVFKKTKMFVFYGNSTDADGGTVFNYRAVDNAFPGNSDQIFQGQVCAAPDGLYIWTSSGVYFTSGGPPALISDPLSRMFTSSISGYSPDAYGNSGLMYGTGGAFYFKGAKFWTGIGASGEYWYVLANGKWSRWTSNGACLAAVSDTLYTAAGTGLRSLETAASARTAYYVSPYSTLGSPGVEKRIRQTELHGSGTVNVSWGKDLQTHGYARSVTMLNGRGLDRTAVRGETLSWKVSGTGAWSLNRVIPFVADQRASGVKT